MQFADMNFFFHSFLFCFRLEFFFFLTQLFVIPKETSAARWILVDLVDFESYLRTWTKTVCTLRQISTKHEWIVKGISYADDEEYSIGALMRTHAFCKMLRKSSYIASLPLVVQFTKMEN